MESSIWEDSQIGRNCCVAPERLVHSSAEERKLLQQKLLSHNLRDGRQHVLQLIDDQCRKGGKQK